MSVYQEKENVFSDFIAVKPTISIFVFFGFQLQLQWDAGFGCWEGKVTNNLMLSFFSSLPKSA